MRALEFEEYAQIQPLFARLAETHLCIDAAIAGTNPGQIWVDDPARPRVGLLRGIAGDFVAGTPGDDTTDSALKKHIPYDAELYVDPARWAERLDRIWSNPFARRQPRTHYVLRTLQMHDWRRQIPAGFQWVQVDEEFLQHTTLVNFDQVEVRIRYHWHSRADFLKHGFGFVLLHGDTIVTRCLADCVVDRRCEMGIGTDIRYRRRGLAAVTVAATVEHCLARGLDEIGWHCLANNAGSRRVAEKVGFEKAHDYDVLCSGFPAENAGDLTPEAWQVWAQFYEGAAATRASHAYEAACAWALAGDAERARALLAGLIDSGWLVETNRLRQSWALRSLHAQPWWPALLDRLEAAPRA